MLVHRIFKSSIFLSSLKADWTADLDGDISDRNRLFDEFIDIRGGLKVLGVKKAKEDHFGYHLIELLRNLNENKKNFKSLDYLIRSKSPMQKACKKLTN